MLALLAFKHVGRLEMVGTRQPRIADHTLRVPIDIARFRRALRGIGHGPSYLSPAAMTMGT
jgi:hypothetical protein